MFGIRTCHLHGCTDALNWDFTVANKPIYAAETLLFELPTCTDKPAFFSVCLATQYIFTIELASN